MPDENLCFNVHTRMMKPISLDEFISNLDEQTISGSQKIENENQDLVASVLKSRTRNRRRKWSSQEKSHGQKKRGYHFVDNARRVSLPTSISTRLESSTVEGTTWTKINNTLECSTRKRAKGTNYTRDDFCSWDTTPRITPVSECNYSNASSSISKLLYSREISGCRSFPRGSKWKNWTTPILKRKVSKFTMSRKMEWKPFLERSIPFSKLETPRTDAVLALDRNGSYMISTSDTKYYNGAMGQGVVSEPNREFIPRLALRFYAVPSPAALTNSSTQSRLNNTRPPDEIVPISPCVLTIPLLLDIKSCDSGINRCPSLLLGGESPMMNTPVKILMSCDGVLGVAFVSNSSIVTDPGATTFPQRNDDVLGTCVIFPLPSPSMQRIVKSIRFTNVRIGGWSSHTWRNLLWPTHVIPRKSTLSKGEMAIDSSYLCNSYITSNYGYIVFNDEDDGFRIFWINASPVVGEVMSVSTPRPRQSIQPKRRDIVVAPDETLVNEVLSDSLSGLTGGIHNHVDDGQQLEMAFEAYLHVDALLCDILERRKNLFSNSNSDRESKRSVNMNSNRLPPFFYNLVSMAGDGRTVTLVIAFSHPCFVNSPDNACQRTGLSSAAKSKCTAAAIALFVDLDLLDQSYTESGWVQHRSRHDPEFLQLWSNTLAINRRMAKMRIGAFCVEDSIICRSAERLHSFGVKTHESNCKHDDCDDTDIELWRPFVLEKLLEKNVQAPKKVAMSSLYPFCDVISNKAVISLQPVPEISCKGFPIRLCYG